MNIFKKILRRIYRFAGAIFEDNADNLAQIFLKRAAKLGDGWSQNNLGCFYLKRIKTEADFLLTIDLFLRAADNGIVEAYLNLGQIYYDGKYVTRDDCKSAQWFTAAALRGDSRGEYRLGLMYLDGTGVDKNIDRARKLLLTAKDKGIEVGSEVLEKLE